MNDSDDDANVHALFAALKHALPTLQALRDDFATQWGDEDGVYRFYHQSFKVYGLQRNTLAIVQALQALAPDRELNKWFGNELDAPPRTLPSGWAAFLYLYNLR